MTFAELIHAYSLGDKPHPQLQYKLDFFQMHYTDSCASHRLPGVLCIYYHVVGIVTTAHAELYLLTAVQ